MSKIVLAFKQRITKTFDIVSNHIYYGNWDRGQKHRTDFKNDR